MPWPVVGSSRPPRGSACRERMEEMGTTTGGSHEAWDDEGEAGGEARDTSEKPAGTGRGGGVAGRGVLATLSVIRVEDGLQGWCEGRVCFC